MILKTKNLSFSYPKTKTAITYPDFELHQGELVAVMGPSGCGKSTLLNLAAGLLEATEGEIVSEFKRISYAFQEPRLFPWMTVYQNVRAVLERSAEEARALEALSFVDLQDAKDLYPRELSGGMKSRIALARALAYRGDLFLLDEPFAALDEELHRSLCEKLRLALKENNSAALLVTHSMEDAQAFADRILTLS